MIDIQFIEKFNLHNAYQFVNYQNNDQCMYTDGWILWKEIFKELPPLQKKLTPSRVDAPYLELNELVKLSFGNMILELNKFNICKQTNIDIELHELNLIKEVCEKDNKMSLCISNPLDGTCVRHTVY